MRPALASDSIQASWRVLVSWPRLVGDDDGAIGDNVLTVSSRATVRQKEKRFFQDFACNPKLLWYCLGVTMKKTFPNQNKKAVPSHLERVTHQWQPASTGGTTRKRVTHDLTNIKGRNCRGFLPAQDISKDQVARPMVGQAGISSRKPRCGCSDGGRGNFTQGGKADTMNANGRDLGDKRDAKR